MSEKKISETSVTEKESDEIREGKPRQCFDRTARDFIIGLYYNSEKTTFTNEEFHRQLYEYLQKANEKSRHEHRIDDVEKNNTTGSIM